MAVLEEEGGVAGQVLPGCFAAVSAAMCTHLLPRLLAQDRPLVNANRKVSYQASTFLITNSTNDSRTPGACFVN